MTADPRAEKERGATFGPAGPPTSSRARESELTAGKRFELGRRSSAAKGVATRSIGPVAADVTAAPRQARSPTRVNLLPGRRLPPTQPRSRYDQRREESVG